MINTSQTFQDEIRAPTRNVYAKIQIDYSDPEIDQSIEIFTNEMANISYPNQVADGVESAIDKIASLDGSWVLGEYRLSPLTELDGQVGWWGSQLSDAYGNFTTPYPTMYVTFIHRPISKLKVVGDDKRIEYPVNFEINLYDELDNLKHTEIVTNNDNVKWEKILSTSVTGVTRMELVIKKWSHPGRQVKIVEFFTSIQETYVENDIISIDLLEEREVSQGSLPVGNISSNEIKIKLNNYSRKFDTGNKNSPLYGLIKPNRRIKVCIGTEHEMVPLGIFWSKNWDVPDDGIIASTVGRDRLDRLRDNTYSNSTVQINKSMYELAEMVLQDAGLNNTQYVIDEELKQFIVPYAYFKPVTHREALRQLATACLGQVYCDREGIIRIEGHSFTLNKVNAIQKTAFLQSEFPAEMEIVEAYGISIDDYFRKDNPSRRSTIANYITVETQPLKPDVIQEIYSSNESISIKANETKTVTIQFNHTPCIDVNVTLEGSGTIMNTDIYAWGADVTVNSTTSGSFTLKATGKPLKVVNKDKIIVQDKNSIIDNGIIRYEFPNNHLIQNISTAQLIAEKLLQYYKDPKRDLTMDWRGNPSLELGDIVTVNDYVRGDIEERGYYYITKQELEYAGYLRAKLEGRRAF